MAADTPAIRAETAAERRGIADLVDTLTPEQWAMPSLCGEWTIGETCGHLLMPLTWSKSEMWGGIVKNGFNFDKFNDKATRAFAKKHSPSDIASGLRAEATNAFTPPLSGHEAPLTDIVLHGQDIRRPLGLTHEYGETALRTALGLLVRSAAKRAWVPKKLRLQDGLKFVATDLDWEWGDGALIAGPAASIAYAMSGRTASYPELTGPGVEVLQSR